MGHACFVLLPDVLQEEKSGIFRGVEIRKMPPVPHKGLLPDGMEPPLTHDELCGLAGVWLQKKGCSVVLVDHRGLRTDEQPDAIGWKSARTSYLVECKTSRADFLADKKKTFRSNGRGMGNLRYFLTPKELVKSEDLPPSWGLLWVDRASRMIRLQKEASFVAIVGAGDLEERALLLNCMERVVDGHPLPSLLRKEKP